METEMMGNELESLSKETLIKLIKVYSRNWQTLDGLWFGNVETACGLDTAVKIDLINWEKQAVIEAGRLKKALEIKADSIAAVLTILSFMSWQLTSPLFEYESETPSKAVIYYKQCAVQEGREKTGKPVFPCKNMKQTLLSGIAGVVNPEIMVKCISCPSDKPVADYWCKWELSMA
ncbi:DUF6125 family protein [Chloroflexota bacterium]